MLVLLLWSVFVVVLVESKVDKYGYDWETLPRPKYEEVLNKLKPVLLKDPTAKSIKPLTVLLATETVKEPDFASHLMGKLYGMIFIDSKSDMYLAFLSESRSVGIELAYGPFIIPPESAVDRQDMKAIQDLVKKGDINGARDKTYKWYKATKRHILHGATPLNLH